MRLSDRWTVRKWLDTVGSPACRVHFGQFGEDSFLADLLRHQTNGVYVDVGCHDPFRYSNTFLLHHVLEWTGVNIDADPRAIERFRAARPKDANVNVGVGLNEGTLTFHEFGDGAVNTFDPALAARQEKNHGAFNKREIPVRQLKSILEEFLPPGSQIGYMNIDVEGLDHAVVSSNDWRKFRPQFLTVELHGVNLVDARDSATVQFLQAQGYRLHSFFWVTALFERVREQL